jgi:glucose/mannose transport system substrate-binding protein
MSVHSFWTEGGELEALNYLIAAFEIREPGVKVHVIRREGGLQGFQNLFKISSEEKNYPDVFQANAGYGLLEWVLLDQIGSDNSLVLPIGQLFERVSPSSFHPAALRSVRYVESSRDPQECGGAPPCSVERYYGLPLNIHRNNYVLYDVRFFAEKGLTLPLSFDELPAFCSTLRADYGVTPIALGTKGRWPLHVLLESVMLSVAGPDFYRQFWRGELAFSGDTSATDTIDLVLDRMLELRGCLNADAPELDWAAGVERITQPKDGAKASDAAAMTVMGDWAAGLLSNEGHVANDDFALAPFPGSERVFVMTVDVFAVPLGAPRRDLGLAFLETLAQTDVQLRFSRIKGSIPARSDLDVAELDDVGLQSYCALRRSSLATDATDESMTVCGDGEPPVEVVFSIAMLLPNRAVEALDEALVDMFKDGEKETVRLMLRNYYSLFSSAARLSGL